MDHQDKSKLDDALKALRECSVLLADISASCCMPKRSEKMANAISELKTITSTVKRTKGDPKSVHRCIEGVGQFGGNVGVLYATCCTPVREPLYQNIYTELNKAHTALWQVLGHGH